MEKFTTSEKQVITSLAWFRTRYALLLDLELDRKADKQSIEYFGEAWIGNFKLDWTEAFHTLVEKGVLSKSEDAYDFTVEGEALKKQIEADTPFFKYEYDQYFNIEKESKAHAKFCKLVYGKNLSQHGLINQDEMSLLIERLKLQKPKNVLDIGCGNGKITEELASQIDAHFTGLDISSQGIQSANERTKDKENLEFREGNFNSLALVEKFDAILFLDTLYYTEDLKHTISTSFEALHNEGRIYAYFSQWIMDTAYAENLKPNNTHLAKVLRELNIDYQTQDLCVSGLKHWKNKLKVLEDMKQEFVEEGSEILWQYRFSEANRYANWGDDKYSRYFYEIKG